MYQFFISSILMPSPDYTIPKLTGYTYEEVLQDPELRQSSTSSLARRWKARRLRDDPQADLLPGAP